MRGQLDQLGLRREGEEIEETKLNEKPGQGQGQLPRRSTKLVVTDGAFPKGLCNKDGGNTSQHLVSVGNQFFKFVWSIAFVLFQQTEAGGKGCQLL